MVTDGPFQQYADIRARVQTEINALTDREFNIQFPSHVQLVGDWTMPTVRENLETLLADDSVDLVIAGGVLASPLAGTLDSIGKPVVATTVLDPELQGIPYGSGVSGKRNLSYIMYPNSLERDLSQFESITQFDKLAILTHESFLAGLPALPDLVATRPQRGFERQIVPMGAIDKLDEWLSTVDEDVDAVYLLPMSHYSNTDMQALADALIERGLPSFSFMGEGGVDDGILASMNPDFSDRIARRVALNVQQILLGRNASEIRVDLIVSERFTINLNTARSLGLAPPLSLLIEADRLIGEEVVGSVGKPVTLGQAIKNGVIENLAMVAEGQRVEVGEQDPRIAKSAFLPQIGAGAVADMIDEGRASLGLRPERGLNGSLTLSQLIFSDDVFANVSIQERQQVIRRFEMDLTYLDITRDIAVLYLEVLRVQSLERIQANNLRVTRTNLDLARIRESLGQAGAGEVIRWESKIAGDRKSRIESFGKRKVQQIALSQAMNRPLNEPLSTVDVTLQDDSFLLGTEQIERYFKNTATYALMEDFLVSDGLLNAPELATFDEALAIQDRLVSSANRAFYLPNVALQGSVNKYLATGGIGADGSDSGSPLSPDFSNTNWTLGFSLNFPLFTGFARSAERTRAVLERERILTSRKLAAQVIEQRIRSQVQLTGMYFASIDQAMRAADAANRSIALVQESYANGLSDILDLIDAQNTVLVTQEAVSNSIYDFLISVIETERAIGLPGIYMNDDERANFHSRLSDFVETVR
jgi:outer membrane protein TolC/ABC-type uncharacterized transport system substrate-binding protein